MAHLRIVKECRLHKQNVVIYSVMKLIVRVLVIVKDSNKRGTARVLQ